MYKYGNYKLIIKEAGQNWDISKLFIKYDFNKITIWIICISINYILQFSKNFVKNCELFKILR